MVIFHSYVKLPEGTLKLMGKSMENHFFLRWNMVFRWFFIVKIYDTYRGFIHIMFGFLFFFEKLGGWLSPSLSLEEILISWNDIGKWCGKPWDLTMKYGRKKGGFGWKTQGDESFFAVLRQHVVRQIRVSFSTKQPPHFGGAQLWPRPTWSRMWLPASAWCAALGFSWDSYFWGRQKHLSHYDQKNSILFCWKKYPMIWNTEWYHSPKLSWRSWFTRLLHNSMDARSNSAARPRWRCCATRCRRSAGWGDDELQVEISSRNMASPS